jgi:hypothetical protein
MQLLAFIWGTPAMLQLHIWCKISIKKYKVATCAFGLRWREYQSSSYWKEIAVVIISHTTRREQCADCTTKLWPSQ